MRGEVLQTYYTATPINQHPNFFRFILYLEEIVFSNSQNIDCDTSLNWLLAWELSFNSKYMNTNLRFWVEQFQFVFELLRVFRNIDVDLDISVDNLSVQLVICFRISIQIVLEIVRIFTLSFPSIRLIHIAFKRVHGVAGVVDVFNKCLVTVNHVDTTPVNLGYNNVLCSNGEVDK